MPSRHHSCGVLPNLWEGSSGSMAAWTTRDKANWLEDCGSWPPTWPEVAEFSTSPKHSSINREHFNRLRLDAGTRTTKAVTNTPCFRSVWGVRATAFQENEAWAGDVARHLQWYGPCRCNVGTPFLHFACASVCALLLSFFVFGPRYRRMHMKSAPRCCRRGPSMPCRLQVRRTQL